jgi:hypothetical protein
MAKVFKDELGIDLTEPKDFLKVKDAYKELNVKANARLDKVNQANAIAEALQALPDNLKSLIVSELEGKSHVPLAKNMYANSVDYNKEATAYADDDLISMYNPDMDKYELDSLDEKQKKRLYNRAVSDYTATRNNVIENSKKLQQYLNSKVENRNKSIEESIQSLEKFYPKQFPKLKEQDIEEIKKELVEGTSNIFDFDKGIYKPEAAYVVAMKKYAPRELNAIAKEIQRNGVARASAAVSAQTEKFVKEAFSDKVPEQRATNQRSTAPKSAFPDLTIQSPFRK